MTDKTDPLRTLENAILRLLATRPAVRVMDPTNEATFRAIDMLRAARNVLRADHEYTHALRRATAHATLRAWPTPRQIDATTSPSRDTHR